MINLFYLNLSTLGLLLFSSLLSPSPLFLLGGFVLSTLLLPGGGSWKMQNFLSLLEHSLLTVKSSLYSFNIKITILFFVLLVSNLSGLLIFFPQSFLNKLSISLLVCSLFMWLVSYSPFFMKNKEKFSLFLVGDMKFPSLSLLLSMIEILTQFFRPITLTARLWVNIWVGHLIFSSLSFFWAFLALSLPNFFKNFYKSLFFFMFEFLVMALQAFVFSYLIRVYFEENEHFAYTKVYG